jgi:hypothetical protein
MYSLIGWIGTALILLAYVQATRAVWPAHERLGASINLCGAILLTISAWHYQAFPNVALELVFGTIAAITIYRTLSK